MNDEMKAAVGKVVMTYSGDSIRVTGYNLETGTVTGTDPEGQQIEVKWDDVSVILV